MKRSKQCLICGSTFYNFRLNKLGQKIGKYTLEKWLIAKTCSQDCYHKWRKGKIFSEKQLLGLEKGRGWNKGKVGIRGEKHPSWKGGITGKRRLEMGRIEYKLWRTSVFMKDKYTCQNCGAEGRKGTYLQADHIKPWSLYPELRYAIDNGRTLCRECHRKTDTYGDLRNYKLAQGYVD